MAVTASWLKYKNIPPYTKSFDYIPFLPIDLDDYIQIYGMKFQGSEIDYVELFLQDEFADIFYSDGLSPAYRANLDTLNDIELQIARFWVYNVKINTVADLATDFGSAVTYDNGPANDGIGATLTCSSNGAFTHDTFENFSVGDKILVKDQTNQEENGIYTVSILGNSSTAWVLTRVGEADTGVELKDVVVTNDDTPTTAYKIDQSTPVVDGSTAITFTTVLETVADLNASLTWTSILTRSTEMPRFVLNKTPSVSPTTEENRSLVLDKRFEAHSYLFVLKLTRTDGTFDNFQIRNLKLMAQFKTKLPETKARPVKIFSAPGFAVIRESMQVEYYLSTTTSDNIIYNVTDKTWGISDKIEVFRQPSSGVMSVVSPTEFLSSGASGNITFLSAQNPTSTITVTISRPLTAQGI